MRMHSSNSLMTAHVQLLVQPQVSMGTGAYNGCCSDAMTLQISDWLFHLEGGTIPPYCALQFLPFISIGVNRPCISIVFDYAHTAPRFIDFFYLFFSIFYWNVFILDLIYRQCFVWLVVFFLVFFFYSSKIFSPRSSFLWVHLFFL